MNLIKKGNCLNDEEKNIYEITTTKEARKINPYIVCWDLQFHEIPKEMYIIQGENWTPGSRLGNSNYFVFR